MRINIYILVVWIMCFYGCIGAVDRNIDKRDITIINKSDYVVYCLKSKTDIFKEPYIDYNEVVVEKYHKITKDSSIIIDEKPYDWDEYICSSDNKKMRLFFIAKDSLDKYGWRNVLSKNIYTKVFKIDINDLEKNKWQITYK